MAAKRLPATFAFLLICASIIATVQPASAKRGHHKLQGGPVKQATPAPVQGQGQKWCIPKLGTPKSQLLKTVNYLCQSNLGIDCKTILEDAGACFHPNNLHMKATYAMNAYYHLKGKKDSDCDFFQFGFITTKDPSFGTCKLQG